MKKSLALVTILCFSCFMLSCGSAASVESSIEEEIITSSESSENTEVEKEPSSSKDASAPAIASSEIILEESSEQATSETAASSSVAESSPIAQSAVEDVPKATVMKVTPISSDPGILEPFFITDTQTQNVIKKYLRDMSSEVPPSGAVGNSIFNIAITENAETKEYYISNDKNEETNKRYLSYNRPVPKLTKAQIPVM